MDGRKIASVKELSIAKIKHKLFPDIYPAVTNECLPVDLVFRPRALPNKKRAHMTKKQHKRAYVANESMAKTGTKLQPPYFKENLRVSETSNYSNPGVLKENLLDDLSDTSSECEQRDKNFAYITESSDSTDDQPSHTLSYISNEEDDEEIDVLFPKEYYDVDAHVIKDEEKAVEMKKSTKLKNQKLQETRERRRMYLGDNDSKQYQEKTKQARKDITSKNQMNVQQAAKGNKKPFLHVVDFRQVKEAWKELVDEDNDTNIFAFSYTKGALTLLGKSPNSMKSLHAYCTESSIVLIAIRIVGTDFIPISSKRRPGDRVRFLLLPWLGEQAKVIDRARLSGIIPLFRSTCVGFHIALAAKTDLSEISKKEITKVVQKSFGSHVPKYFNL
eukprot:CAMPEP_0168536522 /NCGR_PEP_ID=MMETSP0405-20121227/19619_1 /TAXON_ID=498012 /ORGANISM="Trichosphaerium sp, Strain Am-I-7 wt" /LENGTH=387 /DNA_ID=CAMNT_0008564583 /DNA_START=307 /DNA_END=1470 /DNA_ORIENTATION=-